MGDDAPLNVRLHELRAETIRAHQRGEIDTASFEAAELELFEAEATVPAPGAPPSPRFLAAMRKYSGLAVAASDLTGTAAAIVTAAQS